MEVEGRFVTKNLKALVEGKLVQNHPLVVCSSWNIVKLETVQDKVSYNEFHATGAITHMAIIENDEFVLKTKSFKDHNGLFCFIVN
jgi:hypothetical protein